MSRKTPYKPTPERKKEMQEFCAEKGLWNAWLLIEMSDLIEALANAQAAQEKASHV